LSPLAFAWLCWVAPSGATESATVTDDSRIVALPSAITGELPPRWRAEIDAAVVQALATAGFTALRASSPCSDDACRALAASEAEADFVVDVTIEVAPDGDSTVQLRARSNTEIVAEAEGRCSLCGYEELVDLATAKSAALAQSLARRIAASSELVADGEPPGALLQLDGRTIGPSPQTMRVAPGRHELRVTKQGFVATSMRVDVTAGARHEVRFALARAPVTPASQIDSAARRRGPLVVAGATTIAIGLAAVVVGAVLLAIDGRPYRADCQSDADGDCRFLYGTRTGGAVAVGVGGAATIAGIPMVAIGSRRDRARAQLGLWRIGVTF
jgi:hypothetical protein